MYISMYISMYILIHIHMHIGIFEPSPAPQPLSRTSSSRTSSRGPYASLPRAQGTLLYLYLYIYIYLYTCISGSSLYVRPPHLPSELARHAPALAARTLVYPGLNISIFTSIYRVHPSIFERCAPPPPTGIATSTSSPLRYCVCSPLW